MRKQWEEIAEEEEEEARERVLGWGQGEIGQDEGGGELRVEPRYQEGR